jgi:hypothetical protein
VGEVGAAAVAPPSSAFCSFRLSLAHGAGAGVDAGAEVGEDGCGEGVVRGQRREVRDQMIAARVRGAGCGVRMCMRVRCSLDLLVRNNLAQVGQIRVQAGGREHRAQGL